MGGTPAREEIGHHPSDIHRLPMRTMNRQETRIGKLTSGSFFVLKDKTTSLRDLDRALSGVDREGTLFALGSQLVVTPACITAN